MQVRSISTLALIGGLGAAMVGSAASVSHAATIVNWGGNMVTEYQPFSNADGAPANYGGFDQAGDPLLLSPGSGYTGSPFYGHIHLPAPKTSSTPQMGLYNAGTNDFLKIKNDGSRIDTVILWRQADFLEGMDSQIVGFDSTSTVSMNVGYDAGFAAGRMVIRIEASGNPDRDGYYVSQSAPFAGRGVISQSPTTLAWLEYDPANDIGGMSGDAVNLLTNGRIDHITEVGFYLPTNTGDNRFELISFSASAVVVPEPGAVGLLAGAGLLALRRRRATR